MVEGQACVDGCSQLCALPQGDVAGAHPAAELRTPSIPLAPLLAVVGTPGSTGAVEPPRGDAPVLEGGGSLGSPSAPGGGFRGEAAYMSMSRMGMLLPRNSAMPANTTTQSLVGSLGSRFRRLPPRQATLSTCLICRAGQLPGAWWSGLLETVHAGTGAGPVMLGAD